MTGAHTNLWIEAPTLIAPLFASLDTVSKSTYFGSLLTWSLTSPVLPYVCGNYHVLNFHIYITLYLSCTRIFTSHLPCPEFPYLCSMYLFLHCIMHIILYLTLNTHRSLITIRSKYCFPKGFW